MTFTILFLGLIVLVSVVIGVAHMARKGAERRRGEEPPAKGTPVTLDRNPEMPHRPGATS